MEATPELKRRLGGWSVRAVVYPMWALLLILLGMIVFAIVQINKGSGALTDIMRNYNTYIDDASALQSGSTELSEAAYELALMPSTNGGRISVVPLLDYAQELRLDRRGNLVEDRFRGYQVNSNAKQYIHLAAESTKRMESMQQHAIALIRDGYTGVSDPAIANIPDFPLTDEEKALSPAEKQQAAIQLLFGEDYARDKKSVSVNVTAAISVLRAEADKKTASASAGVAAMRRLLWVATLAIFGILVGAFAVLFLQIVRPLGGTSKRIADGGTLVDTKGLYEMRLLAFAYNGLNQKREMLEATLRTAAETDPLTELPNRYRFDKDLAEENGREGRPMAIFSFDLNYLKHVNDTKGHAAGDRLLRSAAHCISACFGTKPESRCYRLGGDEFAAIVFDCTEQEIEQMEAKFRTEQGRYGVSVAMGRAYTENSETIRPRRLLLEADRQMYDNKAAQHQAAADAESAQE